MWARLQKQKIRDFKVYKIFDKRQTRGEKIEFDFCFLFCFVCLFVFLICYNKVREFNNHNDH